MRVQRQKLYAVSRLKVIPRDHEMVSQEDLPRATESPNVYDVRTDPLSSRPSEIYFVLARWLNLRYNV